jgi:replicative DNA helicase Mcm
VSSSKKDTSGFEVTDFDDFILDKKTEVEIKDVSDCLRINLGYEKVRGKIVSISRLYKLVDSAEYYCPFCSSNEIEFFDPPIDLAGENRIKNTTKLSKTCKCKVSIIPSSLNYVNAVSIELQDLKTFSDIEKLTCILFDNNTKNIPVGENVVASGNIHVVTKNKKSVSCLYSTELEYENKENTDLTDLDIKAINRVVKNKGEDTVNWLSSKLFAPSIIGFDIVKTGLLLSTVSSGIDSTNNNGIENRNRLHTIIVGDPGEGKSKLLRECIKLLPNSRYESSQHSSGKSLTAIVSKEMDEYFLKIGSIPLSHGSLCALNEIGRMSYDDQQFLLDVMEEGSFTINKHGINARISSSTVIIASSNPMGSTWNKPYNNYVDPDYEGNRGNFNEYNNSYDAKIDLSKIPVLTPLLDRFDLVFIIRNVNSEKVHRDYADIKTNQVSDPKRIPNYLPYLKKHIQYSKKFNPILTEEAKTIIKEFYIKLVTSNTYHYGSSKRALEKLIRIAKSISKLKLKNQVEAEDAKEALEFFNAVIYQYASSVISIPKNPKDRTVELFTEILKKSSFSFALDALAKEACERDEYVAYYLLGSSDYKEPNWNKFRIEKNKKLRKVRDILIDNPNIQLVSSKPTILKYIQPVSDPPDLSDSKFFSFHATKHNENNEKLCNSIASFEKTNGKPKSDGSDWSDVTFILEGNSLRDKIDKQDLDQSQQPTIQSKFELKHSPNAVIFTNTSIKRDFETTETAEDEASKSDS